MLRGYLDTRSARFSLQTSLLQAKQWRWLVTGSAEVSRLAHFADFAAALELHKQTEGDSGA